MITELDLEKIEAESRALVDYFSKDRSLSVTEGTMACVLFLGTIVGARSKSVDDLKEGMDKLIDIVTYRAAITYNAMIEPKEPAREH